MRQLSDVLLLHFDKYFLVTFNRIDEFVVAPVNEKCHSSSLVKAYDTEERPILRAVLELVSNLSVMITTLDDQLVQESVTSFDKDAKSVIWTLRVSNPNAVPNIDPTILDFEKYVNMGNYNTCIKLLDTLFGTTSSLNSSAPIKQRVVEGRATPHDDDYSNDAKALDSDASSSSSVAYCSTEGKLGLPLATIATNHYEPQRLYACSGLQQIVSKPKRYLDRLITAGIITSYSYLDCFGSNPQVYRTIICVHVDGAKPMTLEYYNSTIELGQRSAAVALYGILGPHVGIE